MLSCWWKEYAECSDGPGARLISSGEDPQSRTSTDLSTQLYEVEEERVGVPVKGGLYEVCLAFESFRAFITLNHLFLVIVRKVF